MTYGDTSHRETGPAPPTGAPRAVKLAIGGLVVALVASAVWLVSVRGEALLIDLYATGVRLLCL